MRDSPAADRALTTRNNLSVIPANADRSTPTWVLFPERRIQGVPDGLPTVGDGGDVDHWYVGAGAIIAGVFGGR